MTKTNTLTALVFILTGNIFSQTSDPLDFWPHHVGDVWQYRDAVTNEILFTRYLDSIYTDTENGDAYLYYRPVGSGMTFKIDSAGNFYHNLQSEYPRYKLFADSGDTWVAGVQEDDTILVTITDIYDDYVFGILTTIKAFTFELISPYIPEPFWLGDDYLARGFGWIYTFGEGGTAFYLAGAIIDSVEYGTIVSVENVAILPDEFILFQNYPNPFNPTTHIDFRVMERTNVTLKIFNTLGEAVKTLVNEEKIPGYYSIIFDGKDLPSGVYFYELVTDKIRIAKKMILLR